MKRHFLLLAALAILLMPGLNAPARAQGAPDAARLEAAGALLEAMGGNSQVASAIQQIKDAMIKDMGAREPTKAKDFEAFLQKEMDADSERVKTHLTAVKSAATEFYAANFTTEELGQLAAFQASAIGKKFQQLTPGLSGVIGPLMTDFQKKVIADLQVATDQPAWPLAPSKAAP